MSLLTLATDELAPSALERLKRVGVVEIVPPHAPGYLAVAGRADAIVVRHPIPAETFTVGERLRIAARHGAGFDFIPVAEATRAGVLVTNVPGANSDAVAEYAVAAMLALARRAPEIEMTHRSAGWVAARPLANDGREVRGGNLGVIGTGRIATRIAEIASAGLGMRVLAHSPSGRTEYVHPLVPLDEVAAESDALVIACESTPDTLRLVDADVIGRMKPTAHLINVARGAIVDTAALIAALRDRRIAGAALDVYEEHPLPTSSPLFELPNVILTPHVAGITRQSMQRLGDTVADQVIDALEGRIPRHVVNPEVLTHQRVRRWTTQIETRKDDP